MSSSWQSIKSELSNNFITLATAPALCVITVLLGTYLYGIEKDSRDNVIETHVITIDSERSVQDDSQLKIDELQETEAAALSEQFNVSLEELNLAASKQRFSLKIWLKQKRKTLSTVDYRAFLIYAARKTTQQEEFELANELFAEIGRKYFNDNLTGFYRAYALDQVDNYRLAKRTYEWQLERHPNHQSSAMNYGLLLLNQEESAAAITALQHAVGITSGQRKAKSLRFLARAYLLDKQYAESIETIRKSILFEPDNSQGWTFLGKALAYKIDSDADAIIDAHQKAIALSPNSYRPYLALANYHFSQLNFDAARELYSKANQFNKSKSDAKLQEALNLLASGRPYSAKELLSDLTDLKPRQEVLAELLTHVANKEFDKANILMAEIDNTESSLTQYLKTLTAVKSSKNQKPNIPELGDSFYWPSRLVYVTSLLRNEKASDALHASEQLIESLPESSEALYDYARVLIKGSKNNEAMPLLLKAQSLQPGSRRIGIAAAELLRDSKQIENALQVLDTLLEEEPRYARAMLLKAKLLIEKADYKEAKTVLNEIIKMDEKNIQAIYLLADVQQQEGDTKIALASLDELLSIESSNIEARFLKINILAAKQKDKALKELERVLKLEPDNVKAIELKNQLLGISSIDLSKDVRNNNAKDTDK